jgi:hypothetical protein
MTNPVTEAITIKAAREEHRQVRVTRDELLDVLDAAPVA